MGGAGALLGILAALGFFCLLLWAFVSNGAPAQIHPEPSRSPVAKEPPDYPSDRPYAVFSRDWDREVRARDALLCVKSAGARWGLPNTTKLVALDERISLAEQKLNLSRNSPAANELDRALEAYGGDLAVCLLLDRSGSTVDQSPTIAGEIKRAALQFKRAGADLAVMGYTTLGWHGGPARQAWFAAGRPAFPGRLCSLLHLRFKDFGEPLADEDWRAMCDARCHFENIDGEALEWAWRELNSQPATARILVLISDGAPVDDSTIMANGLNFLPRHYDEVFDRLDKDPVARLALIGLNDFDPGSDSPLWTYAPDGEILEPLGKILREARSHSRV